MSTFGIYQPGTALLHRIPAGIKLLGLGVMLVLMAVLVDTPARLGLAAMVVTALVTVAGIRPGVLAGQLCPVLWIVVFIFGFQLLFTDWRRALVVCGVLLLSVVLAAIVSLTTRVTDMLATMTAAMGPLGRIGFPVEQVAMALALAIRSIPLMVETVRQVDEARRARGLRFSPRIVVAPIIVSALRTADGFAEALTARGLD